MLNNLKYRNLFGEKWKEQVVNVSFGQFPCESTALKGNHKWVAFPWQTNGGGVLCVVKMGHTRKVEVTCPKIVGHKGPVLDFDFCPFDEGIRGWGIENLWSMEFFVLFFTPPPKYVGASETCKGVRFPFNLLSLYCV